jgi:hypothetical protein
MDTQEQVAMPGAEFRFELPRPGILPIIQERAL